MSTVLLRNSRRKPSTFRMDVKLHRGIKIGELNGKFYIRIQNLTDRRNHISVYGDSGKANQTIEQARAQAISPFEPMRPIHLNNFSIGRTGTILRDRSKWDCKLHGKIFICIFLIGNLIAQSG